VIKDIGADVVALQEVESKKALISLHDRLKDFGVDYPYFEIADSKVTPVKCAVLSKFPIVKKEEIKVGNEVARNILKVTLNIEGNRLILFINHWKSKRGPESMRMAYAKALRKGINKLTADADFILIGDFNSNYNEYTTFRNSSRLNDTNGITGINHILKTIKNSGKDLGKNSGKNSGKDSKMVNEKILTKQAANEYLYNLWLEVSKTRRWSYNFFGKKGSPDNIIVSKGLYDNKGISYSDNSFNTDFHRWLNRHNLPPIFA
jgi:predicted extracellular nuclease